VTSNFYFILYFYFIFSFYFLSISISIFIVILTFNLSSFFVDVFFAYHVVTWKTGNCRRAAIIEHEVPSLLALHPLT
jgi:hypothetical protein